MCLHLLGDLVNRPLCHLRGFISSRSFFYCDFLFFLLSSKALIIHTHRGRVAILLHFRAQQKILISEQFPASLHENRQDTREREREREKQRKKRTKARENEVALFFLKTFVSSSIDYSMRLRISFLLPLVFLVVVIVFFFFFSLLTCSFHRSQVFILPVKMTSSWMTISLQMKVKLVTQGDSKVLHFFVLFF